MMLSWIYYCSILDEIYPDALLRQYSIWLWYMIFRSHLSQNTDKLKGYCFYSRISTECQKCRTQVLLFWSHQGKKKILPIFQIAQNADKSKGFCHWESYSMYKFLPLGDGTEHRKKITWILLFEATIVKITLYVFPNVFNGSLSDACLICSSWSHLASCSWKTLIIIHGSVGTVVLVKKVQCHISGTWYFYALLTPREYRLHERAVLNLLVECSFCGSP